MFIKAIKQTAYAILATATLSLGSAGLTTPTQAASIHLNPIQTSQTATDGNLIEVRSYYRYKGHHRGYRKFHRSHRGSYRGHGRSVKRGYYNRGYGKSRSHKFSRHGGFHRGGHHFKGHRFSHRGGFRY